MRSIPWVHAVKKRFQASEGFQLISVHAPEFSHEHKRANVEAAAKRFDLKQPIYLDNDFGYWRALNNHYWPAFYLADRQGNLVLRMYGEIHVGTGRAKQFEDRLQALLRAPRQNPDPNPQRTPQQGAAKGAS